jgi:integrase
MRRGEIFKLRWQDLDFHRGFIHIQEPKGGKSQKIPMNQSARDLLKSIQKSNYEYVFPARNGGPRKDISKDARKIKVEAGLSDDFRAFHGLRHVYATMLASSGKVDMYTLQKLMTHKSPQMTQRYAHLRDDAMQRAGSTVDDILSDALQPVSTEEQKTGTGK